MPMSGKAGINSEQTEGPCIKSSKAVEQSLWLTGVLCQSGEAGNESVDHQIQKVMSLMSSGGGVGCGEAEPEPLEAFDFMERPGF